MAVLATPLILTVKEPIWPAWKLPFPAGKVTFFVKTPLLVKMLISIDPPLLRSTGAQANQMLDGLFVEIVSFLDALASFKSPSLLGVAAEFVAT